MKTRLHHAMSIMDHAHRDQLEPYYDTPYVDHCYRVMHRLTFLNVTEDALLAALVHDVLEDVSKELRSKFEEDILHLLGWNVHRIVVLLTRREDETYREYIERIKEEDDDDGEAISIKVCDIEDHLDTSRVDRDGECFIMFEKNESLRKRYEIAKAVLTSAW